MIRLHCLGRLVEQDHLGTRHETGGSYLAVAAAETSASNNPIAARDRLSMLKLLPSISGQTRMIADRDDRFARINEFASKTFRVFCVKWQELYDRIEAIPLMRSVDLHAHD